MSVYDRAEKLPNVFHTISPGPNAYHIDSGNHSPRENSEAFNSSSYRPPLLNKTIDAIYVGHEEYSPKLPPNPDAPFGSTADRFFKVEEKPRPEVGPATYSPQHKAKAYEKRPPSRIDLRSEILNTLRDPSLPLTIPNPPRGDGPSPGPADYAPQDNVTRILSSTSVYYDGDGSQRTPSNVGSQGHLPVDTPPVTAYSPKPASTLGQEYKALAKYPAFEGPTERDGFLGRSYTPSHVGPGTNDTRAATSGFLRAASPEKTLAGTRRGGFLSTAKRFPQVPPDTTVGPADYVAESPLSRSVRLSRTRGVQYDAQAALRAKRVFEEVQGGASIYPVSTGVLEAPAVSFDSYTPVFTTKKEEDDEVVDVGAGCMGGSVGGSWTAIAAGLLDRKDGAVMSPSATATSRSVLPYGSMTTPQRSPSQSPHTPTGASSETDTPISTDGQPLFSDTWQSFMGTKSSELRGSQRLTLDLKTGELVVRSDTETDRAASGDGSGGDSEYGTLVASNTTMSRLRRLGVSRPATVPNSTVGKGLGMSLQITIPPQPVAPDAPRTPNTPDMAETPTTGVTSHRQSVVSNTDTNANSVDASPQRPATTTPRLRAKEYFNSTHLSSKQLAFNTTTPTPTTPPVKTTTMASFSNTLTSTRPSTTPATTRSTRIDTTSATPSHTRATGRVSTPASIPCRTHANRHPIAPVSPSPPHTPSGRTWHANTLGGGLAPLAVAIEDPAGTGTLFVENAQLLSTRVQVLDGLVRQSVQDRLAATRYIPDASGTADTPGSRSAPASPLPILRGQSQYSHTSRMGLPVFGSSTRRFQDDAAHAASSVYTPGPGEYFQESHATPVTAGLGPGATGVFSFGSNVPRDRPPPHLPEPPVTPAPGAYTPSVVPVAPTSQMALLRPSSVFHSNTGRGNKKLQTTPEKEAAALRQDRIHLAEELQLAKQDRMAEQAFVEQQKHKTIRARSLRRTFTAPSSIFGALPMSPITTNNNTRRPVRRTQLSRTETADLRSPLHLPSHNVHAATGALLGQQAARSALAVSPVPGVGSYQVSEGLGLGVALTRNSTPFAQYTAAAIPSSTPAVSPALRPACAPTHLLHAMGVPSPTLRVPSGVTPAGTFGTSGRFAPKNTALTHTEPAAYDMPQAMPKTFNVQLLQQEVRRKARYDKPRARSSTGGAKKRT